MSNRLTVYLALTSSIFLIGCANLKSTNNLETIFRQDPLESFNRIIFKFNYKILDVYVFQPISLAWREYIPIPARIGLNNFLSNLDEPASMVNAFLIGEPRTAMIHFTRFFLNSTFGLAGIIDIAEKTNTKLISQDSYRFGDTLGYYGIGYGPYIELPIYSSFTIREDGGALIDMLYPTLNFLTLPMSIGKWILKNIETRAKLLDFNTILFQQQDPYIFIRNSYFQRHNFISNGGKLSLDNNPNTIAIQNDLKDIDK
ncbi:MlaA family lipoprotein [Pantoea sp. Aalb]|uniref:MlaA family lipoprotein n=1 Tax=Pantoea sp. Aalb TaxID=2576762 RepID=UPI00132C522F|nr:MlaA family lipoprotein [Pantoea sp. Aalb]MXP67290.1 phospholipid-binding lipoprotein MlaA [Pantoea sp. Aalb]